MIRWLLLCCLVWTVPAWSETDPAHIARRAAGMLEAAAQELQNAEKSRDRVAALTKTVRAYEEGLTSLRAGLRQAAIRERTLRLGFEAKRDRLSKLLGVLTTIERAPRPLLLLHPSGPAGTARSGMMLSEITPALQAEAQLLKNELDEVRALQTLQDNAAVQMTAGLTGAQTARAALSKAIADRVDLPQRFTEDPAVLLGLLETSDTLSAFAAGLGALEGLGETPDFETLKGALPLPGPGIVLRGFNEPDAADIARPGLILAMRPGTLITSPSAATLRYAGPLLDYGNVIVIEPADGILMVLAGLDAVYGNAGDVLPAGHPLGLMPGSTTKDADFPPNLQQDAGGKRSETLYMELRLNDTPVDPTNWFTLTKDG